MDIDIFVVWGLGGLGGGGGGGGGGGINRPEVIVSKFISISNRFLFITSKEKHSLTRKLVGYRNWRQWWC